MDTRSHGFYSTALRILAMVLMLIDHLGATLFPDAVWMRIVGRLAFPIFAFQTAEGYRHTRNFRRYCLRLLAFGPITELPFDLMAAGTLFYPFHQNVLFTLLLGLLAIRQLDGFRAGLPTSVLLARFGRLMLVLAAGVLLLPDYGLLGVLTVASFFLFRENKPAQFLALAAIHIFGYESGSIPLLGGAFWFPLQGFAVLALIPIWLYNGKKGPGGKGFQYAAYGFYPLHMLILGFLQMT